MSEYIVTREDVLKKREIEILIELDEAQRKSFTEDLDNAEIVTLTAQFTVKPYRGKKGLSVKGEIHGHFIRNCVVSGAPLQEMMAERVDIRYLPENEMKQPVTNEEVELVGLSESAFDLEALISNEVDLYEVLREYVILGLAPYPKAEGAVFQEPEPAEPQDSAEAELTRSEEGKPLLKPFAVLAEYRDRILKK